MLQYFIILDFEANCLENKKIYPQEIIEFPSIILSVKENSTNPTIFHQYINATLPITPFCTSLTGITQEMVDDGIHFTQCLQEHDKWRNENSITSQNSIYITCGDWDLKTALPKYCEHLGNKMPNYFKNWINIKKEFKSFYHIKKIGGMMGMLKHLGITPEGRHHSGIDDTRNITKIVQQMINDGWECRTLMKRL
jgi:inhibitor of KinA sporulation pathway (predicted exonuclease)